MGWFTYNNTNKNTKQNISFTKHKQKIIELKKCNKLGKPGRNLIAFTGNKRNYATLSLLNLAL